MVELRHGRCESLATKERRIELAASVIYQKLMDHFATYTWTPNYDEAKTSFDTIFNSIDINDGEREALMAALRRIQTSVDKQQQQSEW